MCVYDHLTIEQFGFRRGHSTELDAIQLVDRLTKQTDLCNIPINISFFSSLIDYQRSLQATLITKSYDGLMMMLNVPKSTRYQSGVVFR